MATLVQLVYPDPPEHASTRGAVNQAVSPSIQPESGG
jgi:hypothetical protein